MLKQGRHHHPPQYLIQRHRHHQQAAPQLVSPHLVAPALSNISKEAQVSTTVGESLQYKVIWYRAVCQKNSGKKIKNSKTCISSAAAKAICKANAKKGRHTHTRPHMSRSQSLIVVGLKVAY